MAKKTCKTCAYFYPQEDSEVGMCGGLSEAGSLDTTGAEGQFWCDENWYCASHEPSSQQGSVPMVTDKPMNPQPEQPQETATSATNRQRASRYIN